MMSRNTTTKSTGALRRVEQNDATLTHLLMCEPPATVSHQGSHLGITYLTRDDGVPSVATMTTLCDAVGSNTHLDDVCFDCPSQLSDGVADAACFEGLRRNASITSLGLSRCGDMFQGVGYEVLRAYAANPKYLRKLALWRCRLGRGGDLALSATISRCINLKEISLSSCRVDDSMVATIVTAIGGNHHRKLERLDLHDNAIRSEGCQALSSLLKDGGCTIKVLDLSNNLIDNDGATAIAEGLSTNNRTLEDVYLDDNYSITPKGWNSFKSVVCDSSSIDATYDSNHTLAAIASFGRVKIAGSRMYDEDDIIPMEVMSLIELNGSSKDERVVARKKILACHLNEGDDMGPFLAEGNMSEKVVPHLLSWAGRCEDSASQSAVFHLLREMPALCHVPTEPDRESNDKTTGTACSTKRSFRGRKSRVSTFLGAIRRMKRTTTKPFRKS